MLERSMLIVRNDYGTLFATLDYIIYCIHIAGALNREEIDVKK